MKNYGNTGQAVTCVNEPTFEGFVTKSGRTIEDDLARARAPFVSPIKLQPLTPAAERALISGSTPTRRSPATPRPARRKPAQPARLPAPAPAKPSTTPRPSLGTTVERPLAGGGQTKGKQAPKASRGLTRTRVLLAHGQGLPNRQIADQIGVTVQTVAFHLRNAGLTAHAAPRRPRQDTVKRQRVVLAEFVLARMGWDDGVMRRVAAAYSDHPDYRPEWRFHAL